MKTRPLRIIFILILAAFVLIPGRGLGAGAKLQAVHPATLQAPTAPALGTTTRVSVASHGRQGNGDSNSASISADGRYVAFTSWASNLVGGDTNYGCPGPSNCPDIFVHDRQTGSTQLVSIASDGTQGDYGSGYPSLSADGRYVAFDSGASNLVSGDTNGFWDVFVHDRQTGSTQRVSLASDGTQGNNGSGLASISPDGRYVAFTSSASNLVSGDTNNFCHNGYWKNCSDIFVHDRQTGVTQRVSVASGGIQGNNNSYTYGSSISADGRYVAFVSWASNLVSGDTNYFCGIDPPYENCRDIFVHDRQTGITQRVSLSSNGIQGNNESYYPPSISADGRYVAFSSYASNLVSGDTNYFCGIDYPYENCPDIFVHDRQTGSTQLVSIASDGTQGDYGSSYPSISADGRYVAFYSAASNLVSGDTNGVPDIFVHDRQTGVTQLVSLSSDGTQGNSYSRDPSISTNGRYVAFVSWASNLVSGDTNKFCGSPLEGVANIQGFHSIFEHKIGDRSTNLSTPPPEYYNCPDVFVHEREGINFLFYLPVTQNQP